MQQLRGTDLKRLHRGWRRATTGRLALLLEDVSSPFNVGSIVRTAAALGAAELYLTPGTASPRSPKAQKLALGTDRYLRSTAFDDASAAIRTARAEGYRIVGLELADEAVPLAAADLRGDVCLVLGHEDRGLTTACLKLCDLVAFVPQMGRVGSLNVATAAAIGCYEVRRQEVGEAVPTAASDQPRRRSPET